MHNSKEWFDSMRDRQYYRMHHNEGKKKLAIITT